MTDIPEVDCIEIPEYRTHRTEHADAGAAVHINDSPYVPNQSVDDISAGQFFHNARDGTVEYVLAVTDDGVLLIRGDGRLTLLDREELQLDDERLHPLQPNPAVETPIVERDGPKTTIETTFGTVTVTHGDASEPIPTNAHVPWAALFDGEQTVALLRHALATLTSVEDA